MSTNKELIALTRKLERLTVEQRSEMLFDILADFPEAFAGLPEVAPQTLYKVVIQSGGDRIPLIRALRNVLGTTLAETKLWLEGKPMDKYPVIGVCGDNLMKDEAESRLARLKQSGCNAIFAIMPTGTQFTFFPMD